jgi:hypothetical protein
MKLASTVIDGWPKVPSAWVKAGMLGTERSVVQALLTGLDLLGCAHQTPMLGSGDWPPTPTPQISRNEAIVAVGCQQPPDIGRLASRGRTPALRPLTLDYPTGPYNVLEVSVPSIRELQRHIVRVSGEGEIVLPLLGTVPYKAAAEP